MKLTLADLVNGFKDAGIEYGDNLLIHSSLSSLGWIEGGAETVVDALIETVGNEGTIVFPTLTGCRSDSKAVPPIFDARQTPTWTGKIPETARKRKSAIRSLHPTHSVAALGKLAKWITDGHEYVKTPCGYGSPYDKLADIGGKILLIGVTQEANTCFHHAEELAEVPYVLLNEPSDITMLDMQGKEVIIHETDLHLWGPDRDYDALENPMKELGICKESQIGGASIKIMDAGRQREFLLRKLLDDHSATLAFEERVNW